MRPNNKKECIQSSNMAFGDQTLIIFLNKCSFQETNCKYGKTSFKRYFCAWCLRFRSKNYSSSKYKSFKVFVFFYLPPTIQMQKYVETHISHIWKHMRNMSFKGCIPKMQCCWRNISHILFVYLLFMSIVILYIDTIGKNYFKRDQIRSISVLLALAWL